MDRDGVSDIGIVANMFAKFGIDQSTYIRVAKSVVEE